MLELDDRLANCLRNTGLDFAVKQQIRGEGFSALYENYFETQVLRVGINYQFQ